jgi:hypothetical protein
LIESHKLDPRPLDEDPRPIEAKLKWHVHGTILEGNLIGLDQKMELKKDLMVWRIKMQAKVQNCFFHCFSLFFKVFFLFFLKLRLCKNGKHFMDGVGHC